MKKFKLPPLSTFSSRSKNWSPYDYLYKWVIQQALPMRNILYGQNFYGLEDKLGPNVSAVLINERDGQRLRKQVKSWIKRYGLSRHPGQAAVEYDFSYGPATTAREVETGYVNVDMKTLIVKLEDK